MMQQMFIENNEVDISAELSSLLTFAIDDVADFSSRSTTFSKTIILPGTNRNNKTFGNIFDIGQGNLYDPGLPNYGYNYNASKSAACVIFQDNMQTFKGVIRLTQINKDASRVEYETVVFGEMFLLNSQLSGKLLEDLDFSEYDHTLSISEITGSWDNVGEGVYYPLIDHGTYSDNKHDWDYHTFRPAIFVKQYIDKMFDSAGFSYLSSLFETDRFKKLIVPYNQKILTRLASSGSTISEATNPYFTSTPHLAWHTITGSGFTADPEGKIFTYVGSVANVDITASVHGEFTVHGTNSLTIRIIKNGTIVASTTTTSFSFFNVAAYYSTTINPGDTLQYDLAPAWSNFNFTAGSTATVVTSAGATAQVPVNLTDPVDINYTLPKNIRQIDFLVSIVKLFNLYVYEDKYNTKLIHIAPYVDFFDASGVIDWTYKLNRSALIKVKPMSELNAKVYNYNYKQDSDYYNDTYNKRYGQGYGSYIFDTLYEFASQENKLELIFAPTVLVGYNGEDKVYSTIFKRSGSDTDPVEETVDSVIRILQTKKITGVASWNIKDGISSLLSLTYYGYAGHLDDPDAPTNDLNFGALRELFFVLTSGTLSNTQFNLYWSSYMAEITDKDSKLLTAKFYLKTIDIYNLDFSKYIALDGVLFRLNKITDYNMSEPMDCEVELLKVNYTIY